MVRGIRQPSLSLSLSRERERERERERDAIGVCSNFSQLGAMNYGISSVIHKRSYFVT